MELIALQITACMALMLGPLIDFVLNRGLRAASAVPICNSAARRQRVPVFGDGERESEARN